MAAVVGLSGKLSPRYWCSWSFVTGWHIDANGGIFKLLTPTDSRIDVVTARGDWHYVFDTEGRLISKQSYLPKSYGSFPDKGEATFVPTPPWLLGFSQPIFSWIAAAIGGAILLLLEMLKLEYSKEKEKTTNSLSSTPS